MPGSLEAKYKELTPQLYICPKGAERKLKARLVLSSCKCHFRVGSIFKPSVL